MYGTKVILTTSEDLYKLRSWYAPISLFRSWSVTHYCRNHWAMLLRKAGKLRISATGKPQLYESNGDVILTLCRRFIEIWPAEASRCVIHLIHWNSSCSNECVAVESTWKSMMVSKSIWSENALNQSIPTHRSKALLFSLAGHFALLFAVY